MIDSIPDPPDGVSDVFSAHFQRICRLLLQDRRLTETALPSIELLCMCYDRLARVEAALPRDLMHNNSQGAVRHPLVDTLTKTVDQIHRLHQSLGLTAPEKPQTSARGVPRRPKDSSRPRPITGRIPQRGDYQ